MKRHLRGFTLIEVLVAIAILGVGLTAILTAQSGTFVSISHAKNISQATGLVRCKMNEVEADLQTNGFVQNDVVEAEGPCCDHSDAFKMKCKWRVEHPHFPEPKLGMGDVDAKLDVGTNAGGPSTRGGVSGSSALVNAMHGGLELPQNGNIGEMAQALMPAGGGNIADAATTMLMGIAYPEIQQIFENGTRKITVSILWNEGTVPFSNDLVEWYTDARASGVTGEIPTADNDPDTTSTGSGSKSTGSGTKPKPKP